MAEAAKNETVVLRSQHKPLLTGDIAISQSWPTTDIILYVTSVVAVLSLIAFIITFVKLRKGLLILTILEKVHMNKFSASTVPSHVTKMTKLRQPQPYFLRG